MSDSFEQQDWVRTGVAAAMMRSLQAGNQPALEATAKLLTSALPSRTKLEYKGLFTQKLVKVSVSLGDDVLTLRTDPQGGLEAARTHTSRGIALKSEIMAMEEWLSTLIVALEEKARSDSASAAALEAWLHGGES
jgi:hypothetical protein